MSSSIYVAVPVMLLLSVIQTAVLPYFSVFDLSPQLPLLVALSWGGVRSINEGIVWAFVAGLVMDMFSITPLGVTAISYMVAVTAVLWVKDIFPTSRVILPLLLAATATVIYLIITLILLRLLGNISNFEVGAMLWPMVLIHTVVILPVYWVIYSINHMLKPRQVQL